MRSFYARLAALFVVLILVVGLVTAVFGVRLARRYAYEVDQKLNRTLAEELVPRVEPLLTDSIPRARLRREIEQLTGINRRIEIYLLAGDGAIKAAFTPPGQPLARAAVDLAPVRAFLDGTAMLPVLGTDPLAPDAPKPFSAAPLRIMGDAQCYLYLVLGSAQEASLARMLADSYIVRAGLAGLGLMLLVAAGVGLAAFRRLTQRLRTMQAVVVAFEDGDLGARMPVGPRDEIGRLAACFNQMADKLVATLRDLEQADRRRREFIANVSHDLRSPLASVQGYLETVLMKADALDARLRRYVETGLANARRLSHMVDQLFEISTLDARAVEPDPEPFAVDELAHDLVMQAQPRAEAAGLTLRLDVPARLPRAVADIALVERALTNLLDNALRYTPAGGTVTVACARAAEGADVRVAVADTGPGIPAADLPRIFERFYRVEKSRTRAAGGTGLGLAIAQRIVQLHARTLAVESTEGAGTTFAFTLPAEDAALPEDAAPAKDATAKDALPEDTTAHEAR